MCSFLILPMPAWCLALAKDRDTAVGCGPISRCITLQESESMGMRRLVFQAGGSGQMFESIADEEWSKETIIPLGHFVNTPQPPMHARRLPIVFQLLSY